MLIITAYISFITGTIKLSFNDFVVKFTTGENATLDSIIDLRLPRILIAIMVGAMLAVSGALLQAALQNPLAGKHYWCFIWCINHESTMYVIHSAIIFLSTNTKLYRRSSSILIIIILHAKFRFNAVSMILVGVALFVLLNGILEILTQNPLMKIPQGLTMKIWSDVYILAVSAFVGIILTLLISNKLNLLNLDDVQARSIGFNIDRYRWITGLLAVFLASATVAIVGQIAF